MILLTIFLYKLFYSSVNIHNLIIDIDLIFW